MSSLGEAESSTKDIADAMGAPTSSLTTSRAALIKKGLIYAPRHGVVAFTVPMMADFVRRQLD
jgi:hypothetical protein